MTVNYTTNLALGQPVTGTESGTWGDDVNNSVTSYLDIAISGSLALTSASFTANALTLANTQGSSSATNIGVTTAQYYVLRLSSLAASVTITAPSVSKTYLVVNADATYSVTVKASGQTGISIAAGERATVYYNGTDYIKVTSSVVSNFTGVLGVANGGTGVTTSTGSGNTVLSTSPTLVTPVLGTPTSGNLANCTFPTLNQNTTGSSGSCTGNSATATTVTTTVNSGVTGTTQSYGTSNTTIATTAFVQAALQLIYPVGSVYTNASNATNPGTLFGFGTWTLFSLGRMLIGHDGGTYIAGGTGGSATTTLSTANLPSHNHTATSTVTDPSHTHVQTGETFAAINLQIQGGSAAGLATQSTQAAFTGITVATSIGSTGSGTAATTISPYIVVYMWQRTA